MRRALFTLSLALLAALAVTAVDAQRPAGDRPGPEGDRPERGGPGGGRGGFGGRFQLPVMQALDADGDGDLSEKEIENATVALKSLDKDKNGAVSADELRPNFGRGGEGRGPGGPPREGAGGPPGAGAPREGRGGPAAGGRGFGAPRPEEFVDRALEYDADKDGKLSKEELTKWAEQFGRGFAGFGGGRGGRGGADGDQPRRPRRPE
ncbi:MAG TPA: hypothetical protein VMV10_31795 [Pirellulales bacterium]|nr:hypothetical protein [Pirellulales bacterium]